MGLVCGGGGHNDLNCLHNCLVSLDKSVVKLNKLTRAKGMSALFDLRQHLYLIGDSCDGTQDAAPLADQKPFSILPSAVESHVNRSIHDPSASVNRPFNLLEASRAHRSGRLTDEHAVFRSPHMRVGDVNCTLGFDDATCLPKRAFRTSKATSEHVVDAYQHTYGLPTSTLDDSNNSDPHQFSEKPPPVADARTGKSVSMYA